MMAAPTYDNYVNATKYDLINSLGLITANATIPAGKKPLYMRKFYEHIYGPEGALAKVARNITNELKFTYTLVNPDAVTVAYGAGTDVIEVNAVNSAREKAYGMRKDVLAWELLHGRAAVLLNAAVGPEAGSAWKVKIALLIQGGAVYGGYLALTAAVVAAIHAGVGAGQPIPEPPAFYNNTVLPGPGGIDVLQILDEPINDAGVAGYIAAAHESGPASLQRYQEIITNVAGGQIANADFKFFLGRYSLTPGVNARPPTIHQNYADLDYVAAAPPAPAKFKITTLPLIHRTPAAPAPLAGGVNPITDKSGKLIAFANNQQALANAILSTTAATAAMVGTTAVTGKDYLVDENAADAQAKLHAAITFNAYSRVLIAGAPAVEDTIICDFQLDPTRITSTNPVFYGGNALTKPKHTKKHQKMLRRKRRTEKA